LNKVPAEFRSSWPENNARPAPANLQPPFGAGTLFALAAAGFAAAGFAAYLKSRNRQAPPRQSRSAAGGAALLAASVVLDSAMEHYRGSYKKAAMTVAPPAATVTLATCLAATLSRGSGLARGAVFGGAMTVGLFGLGFHLRNILSRPGGLSFNNLFYRAPFGAPGALLIAGAGGLASVAAAQAIEAGNDDRIRRAGRFAALTTAAGLFGLTAEVGLLHFRGAFHDKLMYAPVVTVPLTGAALTAAAFLPSATGPARRMLQASMALGLAGTGLHAYGVSRNNGGFRNWTQNLFQGPPIAAPPSLIGLGLLGLAALGLLGRARGGDDG